MNSNGTLIFLYAESRLFAYNLARYWIGCNKKLVDFLVFLFT